MTNNLFPERLRSRLRQLLARHISRYVRISFSQEGEDLLLRRLFENKPNGFYIDVGAHHPQRFSNTNLFYLQGWRGINIEPNPDMFGLFERYRCRDINIKKGISDQAGRLTYFMFNDAALNTLDERLAQEYEGHTYHIRKKIEIEVCRLDTLLSEMMPKNVEIDFMSVDAEGCDFNVLKSNDWERFRPRIVLVEILGISLAEIGRSDVYNYLRDRGYVLIAKTVNTCFFQDSRS